MHSLNVAYNANLLHADSEDSDQTRPKIIFYLFAIAYLPTLLLPTQLFFFFFPEVFFLFFFFFAVSIFHFRSEILNLYKLMRKPLTGIAFNSQFLSLFLL